MKFSAINKYLALAFGFLAFAFLMYYFSNIVTYVLVAWVLSMLGQPLMQFFNSNLRFGDLRFGNNLSAIFVLVIYLVVFSLLVVLFVPLIVEQAAQLANVDFNAIAQALDPPIQHLNEWLAKYGVSEPVSSPGQQLRETLFGKFDPSRIANFFSSIITIATGFLIDFFSVVFITFFFLKEQGLFVNFLVAIFPGQYEGQIRHAVQDASRLLTRYFGGILLQVTIITTVVTIGLSLLGIPNALLIGLFAALINVIPYVGPIIGGIFGIFVTISSHLDMDFYTQLLPLIFKVAAVFAGMQLLDNFILQPFIFSNSVLAHPLEIFIVILMGAQINGITGMVLAIPSYTVIRLIARVFLSEFRIVQKMVGGMESYEEKDKHPSAVDVVKKVFPGAKKKH